MHTTNVCRSLLPPKSFGLRLPNSEGAACPTIRYYRPWYYVVVLVLEGGVYQEVVARAPPTICFASPVSPVCRLLAYCRPTVMSMRL